MRSVRLSVTVCVCVRVPQNNGSKGIGQGPPAWPDNSIWHELIKRHLYATWAMTGPKPTTNGQHGDAEGDVVGAGDGRQTDNSRQSKHSMRVNGFASDSVAVSVSVSASVCDSRPVDKLLTVVGKWFTGPLPSSYSYSHNKSSLAPKSVNNAQQVATRGQERGRVIISRRVHLELL